MAKLSHTDSRRMYSWWWNSHISPKNSKWLQENLTDMDVKVKSMIKLIEEDADSFARRAEMYYKKRPELMKMVEEFYRAYRALAERYDNATGVIRQAHHTMSEAFPNQVPSMLGDDSPASSVSGTDPRTPDMLTPNGGFADESNFASKERLKQTSDTHGQVERVRRGLNFDELDEKEQGTQNHAKDSELSKPSRESYSEDILALKETLAKLEAEKNAGLVQYQQSSDKLSQLEMEISKTREDFRMLTDHANKAENEVSVLKEKLAAFEAERESRLQDYQKSVEKLNERANTSEIEAQSLKGELNKLAVEKDAALDQYMHCLEIISTLENKLRLTEEDASGLKERAEKSESEVEILRQTISKLTEEKEAAAREYQQCLELISGLEQKLSSANEKIDNGFTKLKTSEEQCIELERSNQSLHSELESLMSKFGTQTQELTEKQKELGKLWVCIQEERLRFVEAETAFQTLQHLHAQTQEELRAMASELQNRAHLLQVGETQNRSLQDEVMKVKEENKHLVDLNVSSSLSIKDMQNEISSLMESKGKLEEEVELRLDQRNALQQEIYCLKEELSDLNKKHVLILDQVHELGLDPESLGSSVKELRDENSCLKETCHRESSEKAALLEKMEVLEQLLVKNSLLEMSLSDLNAELEAAREKIEALEKSCQSFLEEKMALVDEKVVLATQLQETNRNLNDLNEKHVSVLDQVNELGLAPDSLGSSVKELRDENSRLKETCQRGSSEKAALLEKLGVLEQLLVKNSLLETSLSDLNAELESARGKIEALEQSCRSFLEEKSALEDDKATLMIQLQETNKNLEILSKNNTVLEKFLSNLHHQLEVLKSKSKILEDSCQLLVDEKAGLISEKDGLASQLENTQTRLEGLGRLYEELEGRCVNLEEEKQSTLRKVEELNTSLEAERRENASCIQMSEAKMHLLLDECQQKKGDLDQVLDSAIANELEIFLLHTTSRALNENNCSLLKMNQKLLDGSEKKKLMWEQRNFEQQSELRSMKKILCKAEEENMESSVELSVLLTWVRQLVIYSQNLEMVKNNIEREREALLTQTEGLNLKLKDMKREKSDISEEKRSLMDTIQLLEEKTNVLEEENYLLCSKVLALENLSLIFRIFVDEKYTMFREIGDDRNKLHDVNATLIGKLEESKSENVNLKERLHNTEDQLSVEIESGKKLLNQMTLQLQEAEEKIIQTEKQKLELNETVENLRKDMEREKSVISEEKRSLMDNIRHLEGKTTVLDEENYVLCSEVLALENLSLIFRIFADEKLMVFREIGDDRNKLHDTNSCLIGKLEESRIENVSLKERLHRTEDQLSVEVESGKKLLNQMALQLQEAEEKISRAENEKVALNKSVENLTTDYNMVKTAQGHQENHILKLSTDNDNLSRENNFLREASEKLGSDLEKLRREHNAKKIEEENLYLDLQKKVNEINELEILGASIFGQLNHSGVSQLIYEHKFHELTDVLDGYMDQNLVLRSQLDAYGPEIVLLKECISSLENHTDIHIKFPNPENEELQDAQVTNNPHENIPNEECNKSMIPSGAADLHNLTARLQAIVKAAAELKDLMIQENTSLHSKLDDTIKQLEFLQSNQNGRHRRSRRPTSEITSEGEHVLLTKDIVLDQISDGPSSGISKRQQQQPFDADNQMVELWETSDPDGTVGLTVSKSKKITENNNFRRLKSLKKQKSRLSTSDGLSMEKLELLKGSSESFGEGNNRTKVLERLDSDVQKLANLQITVQDLKRKLEATEKGKRGKAVIECEALKGQLEEADVAVVKLFELNERLVKSIDDRSFSDKSSFDLENDGRERRRRVSKQAQRMSEKIGRLQLEVQRLQFVLLKMDEVKDGKSRTMSESRRRVLLRDYLYGVGQRRKKTAQFCACVQPSTVED